MGDKKASRIFSALLIFGLVGFLFNFDFYAMGELECDEGDVYRSIDGTCNNIDNPLYGSTGIELLRQGGAEADYKDGVSSPHDVIRPSARVISNLLSAQSEPVLNGDHATDFIWQWGQFLDHDIDLTTSASPPEPFNIKVPSGDPDFDPFNTGTKEISLSRSIYTEDSNPRQQINKITAFIDASNVYGSDDVTAAALRDPGTLGKLKTSGDNLLPEIDTNQGTMFLAGDIRANEQIALTAMHTLFVREHNRLAEEIAIKHPNFNEDEVYQTARKVVGAEIQAITFEEFLPKLLGPNSIPHYTGYDPSINPGIVNEFSTASYRYGHSQLSSNLLVIDGSVKELVPLRDAFFNPVKFKQVGIDAILQGLAAQKAQEIDLLVVDDVRNFLFGPPGAGGFDLVSLNIQRGRDHGIPDYNSVRMAYGLEPVTSFAQISSNPDIQGKLQSLYGNVNNIDLWVGGLAEDHVPNAMVGETIREVLIDQFSRLRDGDRYWYQNDQFFLDNKDHMKQVHQTNLSDLIKLNTDIEQIQHNVFHYKNFK